MPGADGEDKPHTPDDGDGLAYYGNPFMPSIVTGSGGHGSVALPKMGLSGTGKVDNPGEPGTVDA